MSRVVSSWPQIGTLLLCLTAAPSLAQDKFDVELDDPELSELANTVWAMTLPERDFAGGCVVGFLAFKFKSDGYFLYNNRITGWWRLDTVTGNIRMRTRAGERFLLARDGNTIRAQNNLPFLKLRRGNEFQKCEQSP